MTISVQHAAKIAEDFSEQKVHDAVVTVPVYFNQVRFAIRAKRIAQDESIQ